MRAALRAAAERSVFVRLRAARCAWRDNARCEAARRGIFFSARSVARERVLRDSPPVRRRAAVRFPAVRRGELRAPVLRRDALDLRVDALREELRRLGLLRLEVLRLDVLRLDVLRPDVLRLELLRLAVLRRELLALRVARPLEALRLRLAPLRVDLPPDLRGLRDDFADDLRFGFSPMSTPARRASESPIAMACRAFLAPCSPPRILSISLRTNSPACVLADLPARLSARARWMVCLSGIESLRER